MEVMGLIPGAVSPFGILNDSEHKVHFFIDADFFEEPGLITEDLVAIVKEHENQVTVVHL